MITLNSNEISSGYNQPSEGVAQRCSVKKVFLDISQNSECASGLQLY